MKQTYSQDKKQSVSLLNKLGIWILHILRITLGAVFVFSGFVKTVDPMGTAYKIEDYFLAFGDPWTNFQHWALALSIFLSIFEFITGLMLVFQVKIKTSLVFAALLMLAFTPLTYYLATTNQVSDCGCFGDALVLTNWQTFYKNIIISAVIIILFVFQKRFRSLFLPIAEWLMLLMFIGLGVYFTVYALRHEPMMDFRPYQKGVNISEAMKMPEGAQPDEFNTTFIYQKDGVQKEFTLQNYPADDSTWTFVDQKTVLVKKGYEPPIHNFSMVTEAYLDITQEVLDYPKYTYLLISVDLNLASAEGLKKAEAYYQKYKNTSTNFFLLTSSTDEDIAKFRKLYQFTFPVCKADGITLKTILRTNPGLMLLKQGTIVGKWSWRDM